MANWHADQVSQKYGALTTQVLDFLEPAVNQKKKLGGQPAGEAASAPAAAADPVALQKQLRKRSALVGRGLAALTLGAATARPPASEDRRKSRERQQHEKVACRSRPAVQ